MTGNAFSDFFLIARMNPFPPVKEVTMAHDFPELPPANPVLKRKAMPELPEVQHYKEYIDATSLHHKTETVTVHDDQVLEDIAGDTFEEKLTGHTFEGARRRGKFLFVELDNGHYLQLHFEMTGYPKYYGDETDQPDHERITFQFDNGFRLGYVCQRMLGRVRYIEDLEAYIKEKELGPDFNDLGEEEFLELAQGRHGTIKSFLMNQKYLSGIGNVWSDEVCFHVRIHPGTEITDLEEDKLREIYRTLKDVLDQAVAANAEVEQYPDSWLIKYREEGVDGPDGCGKVEKTEISGRSAYFCPEVQK